MAHIGVTAHVDVVARKPNPCVQTCGPMPRSPDRLLSTFRLVRRDSTTELMPYERVRNRGRQASLAHYGNPTTGQRYAESDLEEWLARHPEAIFPNHPVVLLASQKYARLDAHAPADLLFVDANRQFYVVELKVKSIAWHRGLTQANLETQMQRYVHRLQHTLSGFPACLWSYYERFSAAFFGFRRNLTMQLALGLQNPSPRKGHGIPWHCPGRRPAEVWQIYLAEEFDEQAIFHFRQLARRHSGIRLIYYRYHPEADALEFWEIPLWTLPIETPGEKAEAGSIA